MIANIELLRYGIVGCTGLFIDFGVTWTAKEKWKWNKYIASSLGFSLAVFSNYLLNKWWTFQNDSKNYMTQFLLYLAFALVGLLINNSIIYILSKKTKINFYITKAVAVAVVFIWNFLLNKTYTF
jgi:putative flippase GtrA